MSCSRRNGKNGPRHSAIGDVTPADKLTGREEIGSQRKRKPAAAAARRRAAHGQRSTATQPGIVWWPWSGVRWRSLGGGEGNAGTRPERRPRCPDRGGRHAAPGRPGIGRKAGYPLTVFEITG